MKDDDRKDDDAGKFSENKMSLKIRGKNEVSEDGQKKNDGKGSKIIKMTFIIWEKNFPNSSS